MIQKAQKRPSNLSELFTNDARQHAAGVGNKACFSSGVGSGHDAAVRRSTALPVGSVGRVTWPDHVQRVAEVSHSPVGLSPADTDVIGRWRPGETVCWRRTSETPRSIAGCTTPLDDLYSPRRKSYLCCRRPRSRPGKALGRFHVCDRTITFELNHLNDISPVHLAWWFTLTLPTVQVKFTGHHFVHL